MRFPFSLEDRNSFVRVPPPETCPAYSEGYYEEEQTYPGHFEKEPQWDPVPAYTPAGRIYDVECLPLNMGSTLERTSIEMDMLRVCLWV
ncbi:hypothetical protein B0H13DRAFT_2301096 [Mycena leptocephala]|nr:hypothetical protein B0H13DRAFT_2301096 [Mycena leptocephala]